MKNSWEIPDDPDHPQQSLETNWLKHATCHNTSSFSTHIRVRNPN